MKVKQLLLLWLSLVAWTLPAGDLSAQSLARAIDAADSTEPVLEINLQGSSRSAQLVREWVKETGVNH